MNSSSIDSKITVCFTPGEDCAQQVVNAIDQSEKSILVQQYEFTLQNVADSLIKAKERDVDVRVILDKSQLHSKHSVIHKLIEEKIPVWIDHKPEIAHNKILIIDNCMVITGSFNLSDTAEERNAENLLIITNYPEITKRYVKNWEVRQLQSYSIRPAEY